MNQWHKRDADKQPITNVETKTTMSKHNLKRGRWSVRERSLGMRIGIAVNEDIKMRFALGIRHRSQDQRSNTREMYREMLTHYFCDGYELRGGVFVPILKPEDQLPTFRQFQYFYQKVMRSMPQINLRKCKYLMRANRPGAK